MLDKAKAKTGSETPPKVRPRISRRTCGARSARTGDPHRAGDRQGPRAASAGALAVPGRPARGRSPRLPVHQCRRWLRTALRYSGRGRRARRLAANLRGRHGLRRSRRSARPGCRRSRIRSRRWSLAQPPVRRSSSRATRCAGPATALRGCRCRCRRPASIPRPISPPRSASPAIPKPACRTWAPIAPR